MYAIREVLRSRADRWEQYSPIALSIQTISNLDGDEQYHPGRASRDFVHNVAAVWGVRLQHFFGQLRGATRLRH